MSDIFPTCMTILKVLICIVFIMIGVVCNSGNCNNISENIAFAFIGASVVFFIMTFISYYIYLISIDSYGPKPKYDKPHTGKVVVCLSMQMLAFIILFIVGNIKSDQVIGFACGGAAIAFFVTYVLSLVELWSILPKEETPKTVLKSDIV